MEETNLPKIAKTEPACVQVEAGKTYAWCTCGLSQKQPFCDGSHKATWYEKDGETIKPYVSLRFTAEKDEEFWLCQCKQTKNPPFCDGTHRTVQVEEAE
jgi:CDGSH-type Zn-finger protein